MTAELNFNTIQESGIQIGEDDNSIIYNYDANDETKTITAPLKTKSGFIAWEPIIESVIIAVRGAPENGKAKPWSNIHTKEAVEQLEAQHPGEYLRYMQLIDIQHAIDKVNEDAKVDQAQLRKRLADLEHETHQRIISKNLTQLWSLPLKDGTVATLYASIECPDKRILNIRRDGKLIRMTPYFLHGSTIPSYES